MALTDNLIAHWKLNEASGTRNDSHGSNHLTDNNTVASAVGKLGDAADFELDNSEYLSIADNANLSLGADSDFTWAGWVNPESLVTGAIFSKRTGTNEATEYSLFLINTGTFRFDVGNGSTFQTRSGGTVTAGNWFFFVCWHSSADNKIYLQVNNGTPAESVWNGGTQDTTSELHVGKIPNASSAYFDGLIDSLSFWKRVLTSDERTELYNSGNGLDYPFTASASSLIYRPNRFQHLLVR